MVEVDCLGVVGGCFGLQDTIKQPSNKQAASVKLRKSAPLRKTLLLVVCHPRLALCPFGVLVWDETTPADLPSASRGLEISFLTSSGPSFTSPAIINRNQLLR